MSIEKTVCIINQMIIICNDELNSFHPEDTKRNFILEEINSLERLKTKMLLKAKESNIYSK